MREFLAGHCERSEGAKVGASHEFVFGDFRGERRLSLGEQPPAGQSTDGKPDPHFALPLSRPDSHRKASCAQTP